MNKVITFRLMEEILKNIRTIRELKGFSQEIVAEKLKMSQSQYARFERGVTKTDLKTLWDFATIVEYELIDIITYPKKYVEFQSSSNDSLEAFLHIKLKNDKRDQILQLVLGDNNLDLIK